MEPQDQTNAPSQDSGSVDSNASAPTFGEKAVGLTFNPAGDLNVQAVKSQCAAIIDNLNNLRERTVDPEVKRLTSVAITEAQGAQMWAVKAYTWGK